MYERENTVLATAVESRGRAVPLVFRARKGKLEAEGDLERSRLTAIARRVFSLDLDLSSAERAFSGVEALAAAFARRGGRILRAPTLFEDAIKMLFTTNCTWAATRGMVTRLIEVAGADGRAFPTPEAVARLSTPTLVRRVRCGYRAPALRAFARRIVTGELDLAFWEDPARPSEEIRAAIASERGFGPYSAENLLRVIGRHDFYALDSWTRMKYRRLYPGRAAATDRSIDRRYRKFGAHRGLALWLDMTRDWHE